VTAKRGRTLQRGEKVKSEALTPYVDPVCHLMSPRSCERRPLSGFAFGPRLRDSPATPSASRWRLHVIRCEAYNPSRRNRAPISPDRVQRSTSRSTRALYSAVNLRRVARTTTSKSARAGDSPSTPTAVTSTSFVFNYSPVPPPCNYSEFLRKLVSFDVDTQGRARSASQDKSSRNRALRLKHLAESW
jgi:hypothetical protein